MPLQIIRQDITKMQVDAIVNAANESLLGGGGVDGAIHRAAGEKLLEECRKLGGCKTGQAKLTRGYDLPCRYVIHTVGPIWHGGSDGEAQLLSSCYEQSLLLAKKKHCASVAFPLISTGAYGYPKAEALHIATKCISGFLEENEMTVYLVVFDKLSYQIGKSLADDIQSYIDDHYTSAFEESSAERLRRRAMEEEHAPIGFAPSMSAPSMPAPYMVAEAAPLAKKAISKRDLAQALEELDESFSQTLLRMIDERNMTDAQCYKKANIDRKLFSKIRKDVHYKPSKYTAIAFAIALELDLDETLAFLQKAGFTLSHSYKFDIIIEYFIKNGIYDVFQINEALFAFDQPLLGA